MPNNIVFDIESTPIAVYPYGDYYNIGSGVSWAEALGDQKVEPAVREIPVEVGDRFYDSLIGEVEVIYISDFGQIVIRYSDGSISTFETIGEFNGSGLEKVFETDGWINVIRDTEFNEVFFDDAVYVTEEAAILAFEDTKLSSWELLDTTHIAWDNKYD
jgi:hypothetical protein